MRKVFALFIASIFVTTAPAMAEDFSPNAAGTSAVDEILLHQEQIHDPIATSEQDVQSRWGRRCPRGYVLQRYYVRIGRSWIVQYRCVRHHRGRRPWVQEPQLQQPVQTPQTAPAY